MNKFHRLPTRIDINSSLTLSVPKILKNSIFEMPIITRTLNIYNVRTTSAKSINLYTIRKLIKYSLKNVHVKVLLFEGWSVLPPAQRGTGSERVKNPTDKIEIKIITLTLDSILIDLENLIDLEKAKLQFSQPTYRSSRAEVFCKRCVLENFTKFTGKDVCLRVTFVKFLRISFFIEYLR